MIIHLFIDSCYHVIPLSPPERRIRKAHALFLTSQVNLSDLPEHVVGVEIRDQSESRLVLLVVSLQVLP